MPLQTLVFSYGLKCPYCFSPFNSLTCGPHTSVSSSTSGRCFFPTRLTSALPRRWRRPAPLRPHPPPQRAPPAAGGLLPPRASSSPAWLRAGRPPPRPRAGLPTPREEASCAGSPPLAPLRRRASSLASPAAHTPASPAASLPRIPHRTGELRGRASRPSGRGPPLLRPGAERGAAGTAERAAELAAGQAAELAAAAKRRSSRRRPSARRAGHPPPLLRMAPQQRGGALAAVL